MPNSGFGKNNMIPLSNYWNNDSYHYSFCHLRIKKEVSHMVRTFTAIAMTRFTNEETSFY
ncbi:hypothetical protein HNR53_003244 [Bacillus benzoevorans]|uniref:Uncharacterized protein n=1 Tax=Bacillus benzoevorans TaxID=1456 RepID=A0A7X0HTI5_9BACI|nr:hypothetical protein [Bacillus benzoevorans]